MRFSAGLSGTAETASDNGENTIKTMKQLRITIICILILLLAGSTVPARADTERAENLAGKCSFDFGDYKSAKGRVLSDS